MFVSVESIRSKLLDTDNLYGGAKFFIDFLRYCGAIREDTEKQNKHSSSTSVAVVRICIRSCFVAYARARARTHKCSACARERASPLTAIAGSCEERLAKALWRRVTFLKVCVPCHRRWAAHLRWRSVRRRTASPTRSTQPRQQSVSESLQQQRPTETAALWVRSMPP